MRIAIVHDWLVTYGGAERVLEQMLLLYPDAELFSVVDALPAGQRGFIMDKPVTTTFIQKLPFSAKHYRRYLPLMPLAIEQLDLSRFDLVLSSSYAVAKGVLTGPDQLHLSYIHSPMRYAWDLQHQYLQQSGLTNGIRSWITRYLLHNLRIWDQRSAVGIDGMIANSHFIARRIYKAYGQHADVIYPPVDVTAYELQEHKEDYYVTMARMVPYKRIELIVEAFTLMNKKLVVIGDGPLFSKIAAKAGPNVKLLGYQKQENAVHCIQRAKAFVYAAEEDFGIAIAEAQSCGTPVIAYGKGGALEIIRGLDKLLPEPTGIFFMEQTTDAIIQAVLLFEQRADEIKPAACREHAMRFTQERFREQLREYVEARMHQ